MKCINDKCIYKGKCFTHKLGEGKEINPPTPKYKDECEYYYPTNKDELDKIVDNLVEKYKTDENN